MPINRCLSAYSKSSKLQYIPQEMTLLYLVMGSPKWFSSVTWTISSVYSSFINVMRLREYPYASTESILLRGIWHWRLFQYRCTRGKDVHVIPPTVPMLCVTRWYGLCKGVRDRIQWILFLGILPDACLICSRWHYCWYLKKQFPSKCCIRKGLLVWLANER